MKKRILSMILALALCLSLVPIPAMATDTDGGTAEVMADAVPEEPAALSEVTDNATDYGEAMADAVAEIPAIETRGSKKSIEKPKDVYTSEYIEMLHSQYINPDLSNATLLGDVNSPDLRIRYASMILQKSNIVLARSHPSNIVDNAFAYNNILDTSNGKQASRSAYVGYRFIKDIVRPRRAIWQN